MMNGTWYTGLIAILAALYAWVGMAAHGLDRVLGLAGAVLILTALALMTRSRTTAGALLVSGALPLAIHTWWSLTTPLLAVLVITLGMVRIRTAPGSATPASSTSTSQQRSP